jgi:Domain of unknown function (DUF4429)/Short C-terminal domain
MIDAKGVNGQVTVDPETGWVTIARKGFGRLAHSKGDHRIPIRQITAVQMRPAGPLANGFIRFTVPGAPALRGGLSDAAKDEYAVIFTKKHQAEFDAVRATIERVIGGIAVPAPAPTPGGGLSDRLAQLAELHRAGALSDDEFTAAKTRLIQG